VRTTTFTGPLAGTFTGKLAGTVALTAVLTLGPAACGTAGDPGTGSGGGADGAALTVAATAVPHADILAFVRDNLAEDAGLELTVREFDDYVLPNTAVEDGEVDANFFQHRPYLDDFNARQGTHIVPVTDVHVEPLGLYSEQSGTLAELTALAAGPDGATVAIPDDATNGGRALHLLAAHALIELADGVGAEATVRDVTDAGGLRFTELEAATLTRTLTDVDAAVINGNYALEAKLSPAADALALEEAEGNPYANFLAVKEGSENDPGVRVLGDLLNSDEVRRFIEDSYQGSVLPAF
jgi:D-methionine transport system substrate-binding protein